MPAPIAETTTCEHLLRMDSATSSPHEVPFDEQRWNEWRQRGRTADAATAEKLRSSLLITVSIVAFSLAVWML